MSVLDSPSNNGCNSIYIHVPFCEKKCTYCDFYSIENTEHIDAFVGDVIAEIALRLQNITQPVQPSTIFFGGGTPTLLTANHIERILHALPTPLANAEITMEANPGTISPEKLSEYRSLGVNRLSIGVQSFNPSELEFLTRIHSREQAIDAVHHARKAGFDNVNIDVMFALPSQTAASLSATLQQVLALGTEHVSAYSLIYEHGTPLFRQMKRGLVIPTPEDVDAELYELVISTLTSAGYRQYEVSNFARPDKECRHNLAYWHARDHLSVGPSAHGLLNGERYWNHRSLSSWQRLVRMGTLPQANTETLDERETMNEFVFLTLRSDGIPVDQVHRRFGFDVRTALGARLADWIQDDLIADSNGVLRLTSHGYAVCDELTVHVLEACDQAWESSRAGTQTNITATE